MTFRYWRNGWSDKLTLTPSLSSAYKTYKNLVKFCRLSRLLKARTADAHKTSLSRLFQASMQRFAKLNARQLTWLYCFCILKQCPRFILSDSVKKDANFGPQCPYTERYINVKSHFNRLSSKVFAFNRNKRSLYADDTQLRLSLRADNTAEGQAVLATCTADVRQWYLRMASK